jgi:hypothetical protein
MKNPVSLSVIAFLALCIVFEKEIFAGEKQLLKSCPKLSSAIISPQHPTAIALDKKYYSKSRSKIVNGGSVSPSPTGRVYKFVKVGNFGSANWTKERYPQQIAVLFKDSKKNNQLIIKESIMVGEINEFCINCLDRAAQVESIERILKDWGASDYEIGCIKQLSK